MDSSSSSSPSPGSSKRARVPGIGTHVVSCLVDGCNSDLSQCRDYHRRHKVCEVHSKTPKVTIGGHEQRFCQQCSRFHSLVEFDEGKRSCRKRLDGHNKRRRKPQPESLPLNSGRFLSSHQGARLFPFSSPQIFPTSTVVSSSWDRVVKVENDAMIYNSHQQLNLTDRKYYFPESFSHSYKGGKQISFLQDTDHSTLPGASVTQPLLSPSSISKSGGNSSQKMFSNQSKQAIESDRALSLLSSPSAKTRQIGLSRMVQQPEPIPPVQSLIPNLQYNGSEVEVGPVDSVLAVDGSSSYNVNLQCQGMFQIGHGGSSASESHQTISFSWE